MAQFIVSAGPHKPLLGLSFSKQWQCGNGGHTRFLTGEVWKLVDVDLGKRDVENRPVGVFDSPSIRRLMASNVRHPGRHLLVL